MTLHILSLQCQCPYNNSNLWISFLTCLGQNLFFHVILFLTLSLFPGTLLTATWYHYFQTDYNPGPGQIPLYYLLHFAPASEDFHLQHKRLHLKYHRWCLYNSIYLSLGTARKLNHIHSHLVKWSSHWNGRQIRLDRFSNIT